ncbi:MAG: hypothetical protein ACO3JL_17600 [Myxococcota bacterium]
MVTLAPCPAPMAKRVQSVVVRLALVFALLLPLPAVAEPASPKEPVFVVVHQEVPLTSVTSGELKALLLGRQRYWPDGQSVQLVMVAAPSPERRMFVEQLSGMSEIQFRQYWVTQVFNTRVKSAPRAVPDRGTAVAVARALPGTLTLVSGGPVPVGVKMLRVDDLTPSDPGYPLR